MDAILKIEAALAAGPTLGPWNVSSVTLDNDGVPETVIEALDASAVVAVALDFGGNNPGFRPANAMLIAACNPSAIREVLQTLASKEAELVRLREAMLEGAQRIESLKRDCGADPESPIAIQNGRYMGVSYFLRAAIQPPKEPT